MSNAKYWTGICYLENMIEGWQDKCGDILQIPFAYCIHDKDLDKAGEDRKPHVHFLLAFKNTTTYNHALETLQTLSEEGQRCINKVERVIYIRHIYEYLIHNTEDAKKAGKHLYETSERVERNNFDIGAFEQIDILDEMAMLKEVADMIIQCDIENFVDLYKLIISDFDTQYFKLLKGNQHFFEALTKGNYLKNQQARKALAEGK